MAFKLVNDKTGEAFSLGDLQTSEDKEGREYLDFASESLRPANTLGIKAMRYWPTPLPATDPFVQQIAAGKAVMEMAGNTHEFVRATPIVAAGQRFTSADYAFVPVHIRPTAPEVPSLEDAALELCDAIGRETPLQVRSHIEEKRLQVLAVLASKEVPQ